MKKKSRAKVVKTPKGEPKKIKVGYRDIVIKWVAPNFKTDELTDAFGQYKSREGSIDDAEELSVNQITNYLMGVFRDNPWFLDYIKDNINKDL